MSEDPESGDIELGRPLETAACGGNGQTESTHVTELENSFESYDGNIDDQGSNSELQQYYKDDETENGDIRIPTYFKTYVHNGGSVKPNAPPHSYTQNHQPQFTD